MKYFTIFLIFLSLVFVSCAREDIEIKRHEHTAVEENRIAKYGEGVIEAQEKWKKLFAGVMGDESGVDVTTINDILWATALDKVSFMPLNDVDKVSGVIITDWYTINSESSDQRIKINIFVKSSVISPESLDVKIFQEQLIENVWAQVDRNTDLELKIKESILNAAINIQLAAENL